jgi:hypothetical protein
MLLMVKSVKQSQFRCKVRGGVMRLCWIKTDRRNKVRYRMIRVSLDILIWMIRKIINFRRKMRWRFVMMMGDKCCWGKIRALCLSQISKMTKMDFRMGRVSLGIWTLMDKVSNSFKWTNLNVSSRLNSAILDLTRDKMKVRMGAGVCSYAKTKASSQSQITNWTRVTFKMANHSLVSLNKSQQVAS